MDSKQRFSDRVDNYVKYRPSYPASMVDFLLSRVDHPNTRVCADIGSGTGILTGLLLPHFSEVWAVEPNDEMMAFAESSCSEFPAFHSIKASAEETTLEGQSVDVVVVSQAFHWFDQEKFQSECRRILSPSGFVALIWNSRIADTPFLEAYDRLLKLYATDYNEVNHQNISPEQLARFFSGGHEKFLFPNSQSFDLKGLFGRLDSSSYAPKPGSPEYDLLRKELREQFERHAAGGRVEFLYDTEVFLGSVN